MQKKKKKYITIRPWESNAPHHLVLNEGEVVWFRNEEGENPDWKDWVYCESSINSGWVPKDIIEIVDDNHIKLLEDYTAKELSVGAGDVIIGIKKHSGWVFGEHELSKEQGWLPEEILLKLSLKK